MFLVSSCITAPDTGKVLGDEYYNLGNAWFDLKKYDQAARAYQIALTWNPLLKIATLNLARSKAELGDPAAALQLLEPLQTSDPDNLIVAQYRAWLTAKHLGLAAAADLYVDLVLKLPGDAGTQLNAGLCLKAADRPDEALKALEAWKGLDGKSWVGLSALAELLQQTGSFRTAEAWYDAAQALPVGDTGRFAPLSSWAKALEDAELYGDAVKAWEETLAVPEAPDQPRGEAHFQRGKLLLLKIEDYEPGLEALLSAWKADFKDTEAWDALRNDPALKYAVKLEADLKLAGVEP